MPPTHPALSEKPKNFINILTLFGQMPKLTRTEMKALRSIYRGHHTLPAIASDLGISNPRITSLTKTLERKGFVRRRRNGASVVVDLTNQRFMEHLKRLFSRNLQFENMLGGSAVPLLFALVIPGMAAGKNLDRSMGPRGLTVKQIRSFSRLSRDTIYRTLNKLMLAGAVFKDGDRCGISASMNELHEFIEQYAYFRGSEIVAGLMGETRVIRDAQGEMGTTVGSRKMTSHFVAGGELIVSVSHELSLPRSTHVAPTAITAFQQDGLMFQTSTDYYHYSMAGRTLGREDFAIDHILLDPGSVRNLSYSMLYLLKSGDDVDWDYLLETGSIFGVGEITRTIIDYLHSMSNGGKEFPWPFPGFKEFKDLCNLYGIKYDGEVKYDGK